MVDRCVRLIVVDDEGKEHPVALSLEDPGPAEPVTDPARTTHRARERFVVVLDAGPRLDSPPKKKEPWDWLL